MKTSKYTGLNLRRHFFKKTTYVLNHVYIYNEFIPVIKYVLNKKTYLFMETHSLKVFGQIFQLFRATENILQGEKKECIL